MEYTRIVTIDGIYPTERAGASLNYYDNKLYLFGGNNDVYYSELWIYYINENIWKNIETKNDYNRPQRSSCQGCVIYKDYMIMFGGYFSEIEDCHNNTYILDLDTHKWKLINTLNKPKERCSHGMCVINNTLIISCGEDVYDDLYNNSYMINIDNILTDNNPKWYKIDLQIGYLTRYIMFNQDSILICFGGAKVLNDIPNIYTNNFIIYYNIESIINSNNISILISGYMNYIKISNQYYIPKVITLLIQKFVGLIFNEFSIDLIQSRYSHNGCIFLKNNKLNLFVFGGSVGESDDDYGARNDTYIISGLINHYSLSHT